MTYTTFLPTLEELEERIMPTTTTDKQIKELLEVSIRTAKVLASPRTIIPKPTTTPTTSTARLSSTSRENLTINPAIKLTDKRVYSMETSFMVYDPAVQLAISAVTDNRLRDRINELAGRGGRDKHTNRFVGYNR